MNRLDMLSGDMLVVCKRGLVVWPNMRLTVLENADFARKGSVIFVISGSLSWIDYNGRAAESTLVITGGRMGYVNTWQLSDDAWTCKVTNACT